MQFVHCFSARLDAGRTLTSWMTQLTRYPKATSRQRHAAWQSGLALEIQFQVQRFVVMSCFGRREASDSRSSSNSSFSYLISVWQSRPKV